jgi:hypothetical protein
MVRFDMRWNAPAKLVFRVLGGVLGVLFIIFGILVLVTDLKYTYDHPIKGIVPPLFCGTLFIIVSIRGRLWR